MILVNITETPMFWRNVQQIAISIGISHHTSHKFKIEVREVRTNGYCANVDKTHVKIRQTFLWFIYC
jgi:hypothetical protein